MTVEKYMLPCLNKYLWGIDCMGCGLQRSILLLLQGKLTAAFYMYPAIYPMVGFVLFLILDFFTVIKYSWYIKLFFIVSIVGFMVISYAIKMKIIFN